MADMLPRLFFECFQGTCFAAVREEGRPELVGFLVGFVSQTQPQEANIHFAGVRPDLRMKGLAKELYERFFEAARLRAFGRVRCITSPANKEIRCISSANGI